MNRGLRILLILIVVIIVIPIAGGLTFLVLVDPNAYKPRIESTVEASTGRKLDLAGKLSLSLFPPSLEARDITFANMPGGSRPEMAKIARISGKLALGPLFSGRIEITALELDKPDILLETDRNGRPNWEFAPAEGKAASSAAAKSDAADAKGAGAANIDIRRFLLTEGHIDWRDGKAGTSRVIDIPRLALSADSQSSPLVIDAGAKLGSETFSLTGTVGAIDKLMGRGAGAFPFDIKITLAGAELTAKGVVADPQKLTGYDVTAQAKIPAIERLVALWPDSPAIPKLHDIALAVRLREQGGAPVPQTLSLKIGASDLAGVMPGLVLETLSLEGAAADKPVAADLRGTLGGKPFKVTANLDTLSVLAKGQGVNAADLRAEAPAGTLTGGLGVTTSGRIPDLRAWLRGERLDADALMAMLDTPATAAPVAARPASGPATAAARPDDHLIPATPLPWAALRQMNATADIGLGVLQYGGTDYRNAALKAELAGGKLHVERLAADMPGGAVTGTADADAAAKSLILTVRAPALDAGKTGGLSGWFTGTTYLDANLRGAGDTVRALAATASGRIGLAVENGELDRKLIPPFLTAVLSSGGLPGDLGGAKLDVRCFTARLDLQNGQGSLSNLVLDGSRFHAEGNGALSLAAETMDLHITPLARIGNFGGAIPVRVNGPWRGPQVGLDGAGGGKAVTAILGALSGQPQQQQTSREDCATAVAAAKGQAAPASTQPAPRAPVQGAPLPAPNNPANNPVDTLRRFFR